MKANKQVWIIYVGSGKIDYGSYLSAVCTTCYGNNIGNSVKAWKQDEFIHAFETDVLPDGKQFGPTISSNTFREMTDTELNALCLYFTSDNP